MTPKQFVKKFPEANWINQNCLEDIACPHCGNRERFSVEVTTHMEIVDDGTDDHGDTEWDDESHCRCCDCNEDGAVKDFKIPGLDAYLEGN
jgi:hypothetical protein